MTNRKSIPWFNGEAIDKVSVGRFADRLAEMIDTHAALPVSVAAWQAYAHLLLAARRDPHQPLAHVRGVREMLSDLEVSRPVCGDSGLGTLRRYEFVPGPDARAAVYMVPASEPRCHTCGMAPDTCDCEAPAFDAAPAYPLQGERYTIDADAIGALITRNEDGASVYIQPGDERAELERGIMAMQQLGHDDTDIADTIGEDYDHILGKGD